jgi:hypothetical protein
MRRVKAIITPPAGNCPSKSMTLSNMRDAGMKRWHLANRKLLHISNG